MHSPLTPEKVLKYWFKNKGPERLDKIFGTDGKGLVKGLGWLLSQGRFRNMKDVKKVLAKISLLEKS